MTNTNVGHVFVFKTEEHKNMFFVFKDIRT